MRRLKEISLTKSPMVGPIAYKDIEIASGEIPPPENPPADARKVDMTLVGAGFKESPTEFLKEEIEAADQAIEHVKAIDTFLTKTVGATKAINFKELEALIKKMKTPVVNALAERGEGAPAEAGGDGAGAAGARGGSGSPISGDVRTPQDVIRMIDKIMHWYELNEPSSPVPLLLRRAKGLVSKNFLEVIKDLTPDQLRAMEALAGIPVQQS
jgi:type VI secretion system protein ImpA